MGGDTNARTRPTANWAARFYGVEAIPASAWCIRARKIDQLAHDLVELRLEQSSVRRACAGLKPDGPGSQHPALPTRPTPHSTLVHQNVACNSLAPISMFENQTVEIMRIWARTQKLTQRELRLRL